MIEDNTEEILVKDKTKAYIAGLIDGDGSLYIRHGEDSNGCSQYVADFHIYNTYLPIMKWLVKHFGGSWSIGRDATDEHKTSYVWSPQGAKHSDWVLSLIIPYLQQKREQAKIFREYYALNGKKNPEKRFELYTRCYSANHKDSVTTETLNFPEKQNLVNAYYAGLADAEGTFTIKCRDEKWGNHYVVEVSATNTFEPIIRYLKSIYGGSIYPRKRSEIHKKQYDWAIYGAPNQEKFILNMLPYLVIKKHNANVVLQFLRMSGEHNNEKRAKLFKSLQ
jgi:hypothetical protein